MTMVEDAPARKPGPNTRWRAAQAAEAALRQAELDAAAKAVAGWGPGDEVTGVDGIGCPNCEGPLVTRAPSKPHVWVRRWVLDCVACRRGWLLELRIGSL